MSQQDEINLFWKRTVRAIDDVIACLDEAPAEAWNWKPVESGNSLYALATARDRFDGGTYSGGHVRRARWPRSGFRIRFNRW